MVIGALKSILARKAASSSRRRRETTLVMSRLSGVGSQGQKTLFPMQEVPENFLVTRMGSQFRRSER